MTSFERSTPETAIETYELLQRVHYTLDAHSRNELRTHGLTVPQFDILRHASREVVPLNVISARMLCDSSNLTGIVDRLISEGLVERHVDSHDRRVRLIRLTPAGEAKLRSIGPLHYETISQRFRALSEDQVTQLRDLLAELNYRMQSDGTDGVGK